MSELTDRGLEDCTIVRKPCGCVTIMCVTSWMSGETKREIGKAVAEGCSVEHMTAMQARLQEFGCNHGLEQNDLFITGAA